MSIAGALLMAAVMATPQPQMFPERKALGYSAARRIVEVCEDVARKNGYPPLAIAVVDEGGHLVYFVRHDEARYAMVDFAMEKAVTALITRSPSKRTMDRMLMGETHLLSIPNYVGMQGGLPIMDRSRAIGAVGVTGATAQQDEDCARAGIEAVVGQISK